MSHVSIIIPTYNRAKTLTRAVNSVIQQSFLDWELIIVDDGSSDNTKLYVHQIFSEHKFGDKIKYIKTKNQGVSAARNLGVKLSRFKWVSFLDSDDEWLEDKLKKQWALTQKYSIIHGEEIWVRHGVRVNPMKKHKKRGGRIFLESLPLCCVSPSTVLMKKEVFNQMGGFNESFPVCEDYDLWLRIFSKYEAGFVEDPIIKKYGGHEDQLSRKFIAMDYWRVKSLNQIIKDKNLSEAEIHETRNMIIKKSRILMNGYKKHNNLANYNEIFTIHQNIVPK